MFKLHLSREYKMLRMFVLKSRTNNLRPYTHSDVLAYAMITPAYCDVNLWVYIGRKHHKHYNLCCLLVSYRFIFHKVQRKLTFVEQISKSNVSYIAPRHLKSLMCYSVVIKLIKSKNCLQKSPETIDGSRRLLHRNSRRLSQTLRHRVISRWSSGG